MPPSVTTPLTLYVLCLTEAALTETASGMPTSERASKVPPAFTLPWPGLYGVNSVSHRSRPAELGVLKTLSTVNFASSSCTPCGERPGVPSGTSGGPRQVTSL